VALTGIVRLSWPTICAWWPALGAFFSGGTAS
jgi:hypothetical protein